MKTFFATVLLGAAAVFAFDAAVDPANHWRGRNYAISADWPADKVWITPFGYDERAYVAAHLSATPRPEVLLLGSSKVMMADSAMFAPGRAVFNAGLSGASVEDYIAVWQILKDEHKLPRRVVIFADGWIFNRNAGQPRWQTNMDPFYRFIAGRSISPRRALASLWLRKLKRDGAELADLFTWKTFQAALVLRRDARDASLVPLAALPEDRGARRFDGSLIYPKKSVAALDLAQIREKAREFLAGDIYSMTGWSFDQNAAAEMRMLLADMIASGAEVTIVTPPYQTFVTQSLRQRPDYREIFASVDAAYVDFQAAFGKDHLKLCDALDATPAGCSETDFIDALHARRECVERVLRWCGATRAGS